MRKIGIILSCLLIVLTLVLSSCNQKSAVVEQLEEVDGDEEPAVVSELITSPPTSDYVYANWDCKNQAQCITVMGHNTGSVGPFCSMASCTRWHETQILGTCTPEPLHPVYGAPPDGTCSEV